MRIIIPYGTLYYGKVDQVSDVLYVATLFFHIGFIPLIPLKTFVLFDKKSKYQHLGGVRIRINLKSVFVGYMRAIFMVLGIIGILYGIALFLIPEFWGYTSSAIEEVLPYFIGGVVCILLYALSFELFRASDTRAKQLKHLVGIDRSRNYDEMIFGQVEDSQQEQEFKEDEKKQISGISPKEIGILSILIVVVCVALVILGSMYFGTDSISGIESVNTYQQSVSIQSSVTPSSSPTPAPSSTPKPTRTPIAGWDTYKFWGGKAEISMPAGFLCADLTQGNQEFMQAFQNHIENDDQFVAYVEQISALPDRVFIAFDTYTHDATRLAQISIEDLGSYADISMGEYLDAVMENLPSYVRVVGREIIQLENYQAGKLLLDDRAFAGDDLVPVRTALYTIKVDNIMWIVMYDVERDNFNEFLPVIELSIRSFAVKQFGGDQ